MPIGVAVGGSDVYATNNTGNSISGYSTALLTGALSQLQGSPFNTGRAPVGVVGDATGQFLYNVNSTDNNISPFNILGPPTPPATTPVAGSLAPIGLAKAIVTSDDPDGIAITPDAKYVYAPSSFPAGENNVIEFRVDPNSGGLTPFREAFTTAFLSGTTTPDPSLGAPRGLAITPNGKFLYAVNSLGVSGGSIAEFTIDPNTGRLSPDFAPPLALLSTLPERIAIEPSGHFAYITNNLGGPVPGTVTVLQIDQTTGFPTPIQTISAGIFPRGVAVHPTGGALYVTNFLDTFGTVTVFGISGGTLFNLGPGGTIASVKTGNLPLGVAAHPNGKFVYVVNTIDKTISQFAIAGGGLLTPLNPPTAAAGNGASYIAIDPTGALAFVTNSNDKTVQVYTIGGDGQLTSIGTGATGFGLGVLSGNGVAVAAVGGLPSIIPAPLPPRATPTPGLLSMIPTPAPMGSASPSSGGGGGGLPITLP
jgi:DNA-binding beta-propeller fold protein YncE